MGAKHYEELEVWQIAFRLTRAVYAVSKSDEFARDFALKDQIRRAALSTMTNTAEGFARSSKREFVRFLDIARASGMEVQSMLHLAVSQDYVSDSAFRELYDCCEHFRAGTTALMRHLRSQI